MLNKCHKLFPLRILNELLKQIMAMLAKKNYYDFCKKINK